MSTRGFAIVGALLAATLALGCAARSEPVAPVAPPAMRALESATGLPLRIAPGWSVRDKSADAIWLISEDGKSEMFVSRLGGPWPDYAARVRREDEQVASLGQNVATPRETQLFGSRALATSSSERATPA